MEKAAAETTSFILNLMQVYTIVTTTNYIEKHLQKSNKNKSEKPLNSLKFNNTIFKYPMDQEETTWNIRKST